MTTTTYFIAGATRGIGLEFVRQLSENPSNVVVASARSKSNTGALGQLAAEHKNIHIVELEVGTAGAADKLPAQISEVVDGIDVYIHNAGISDDANIPVLEAAKNRDLWLKHYTVNVLGPIEVFAAVYPFILKKPTRKIIFLSSAAGSLGEFFAAFQTSAYGQSKAALNFSTLQIAHETSSDKTTVIALHPGIVRTEMSQKALADIDPNSDVAAFVAKATASPEVAVTQILALINKLTTEDTAKWYHYDGSVHPW